jgi:hypothetical protein
MLYSRQPALPGEQHAFQWKVPAGQLEEPRAITSALTKLAAFPRLSALPVHARWTTAPKLAASATNPIRRSALTMSVVLSRAGCLSRSQGGRVPASNVPVDPPPLLPLPTPPPW